MPAAAVSPDRPKPGPAKSLAGLMGVLRESIAERGAGGMPMQDVYALYRAKTGARLLPDIDRFWSNSAEARRCRDCGLRGLLGSIQGACVANLGPHQEPVVCIEPQSLRSPRLRRSTDPPEPPQPARPKPGAKLGPSGPWWRGKVRWRPKAEWHCPWRWHSLPEVAHVIILFSCQWRTLHYVRQVSRAWRAVADSIARQLYRAPCADSYCIPADSSPDLSGLRRWFRDFVRAPSAIVIYHDMLEACRGSGPRSDGDPYDDIWCALSEEMTWLPLTTRAIVVDRSLPDMTRPEWLLRAVAFFDGAPPWADGHGHAVRHSVVCTGGAEDGGLLQWAPPAVRPRGGSAAPLVRLLGLRPGCRRGPLRSILWHGDQSPMGSCYLGIFLRDYYGAGVSVAGGRFARVDVASGSWAMGAPSDPDGAPDWREQRCEQLPTRHRFLVGQDWAAVAVWGAGAEVVNARVECPDIAVALEIGVGLSGCCSGWAVPAEGGDCEEGSEEGSGERSEVWALRNMLGEIAHRDGAAPRVADTDPRSPIISSDLVRPIPLFVFQSTNCTHDEVHDLAKEVGPMRREVLITGFANSVLCEETRCAPTEPLSSWGTTAWQTWGRSAKLKHGPVPPPGSLTSDNLRTFVLDRNGQAVHGHVGPLHMPSQFTARWSSGLMSPAVEEYEESGEYEEYEEYEEEEEEEEEEVEQQQQQQQQQQQEEQEAPNAAEEDEDIWD
eukprot:TRINITY_DN18832_c0_g1_i1.p1 TRINITY_DN18832_c0_g1~~TRINITY_DN18832_c0_g1_i1.p1  ORF type:complete len:748 (+),score=203.12 TRINITY_DN18832_c0_g1_i1:87-2246(+)